MSGKKLAKLTMLANRIRQIVSFELGEEIDKDVFHFVTSMGQRNILSPHEETNALMLFHSSGGLRILSLSHTFEKTKNIFLY